MKNGTNPLKIRAKVAVARRVERAENGNLGDVQSVGNGVSEMRIDVGAGFRVYYTLRGTVLIILLAGGTKKSQQSDIKKAVELAKEF